MCQWVLNAVGAGWQWFHGKGLFKPMILVLAASRWDRKRMLFVGGNCSANCLWADQDPECERRVNRNGKTLTAEMDLSYVFLVRTSSYNDQPCQATRRSVQYWSVHISGQNAAFLWGGLNSSISNTKDISSRGRSLHLKPTKIPISVVLPSTLVERWENFI